MSLTVFCMHFRSKTAPFLLFSVCKALKSGMAGLFGPQSSVTSSHVQSICDTLEIPHIETRWDYRMKRDDYSVNLYPHPFALGQVCQMPSTLRGKIYSKCPGHQTGKPLELRQHNNNSILSNIIPTLKLPRFFITFTMRKKRGNFKIGIIFD